LTITRFQRANRHQNRSKCAPPPFSPAGRQVRTRSIFPRVRRFTSGHGECGSKTPRLKT
jgi:hypothetical protein